MNGDAAAGTARTRASGIDRSDAASVVRRPPGRAMIHPYASAQPEASPTPS